MMFGPPVEGGPASEPEVLRSLGPVMAQMLVDPLRAATGIERARLETRLALGDVQGRSDAHVEVACCTADQCLDVLPPIAPVDLADLARPLVTGPSPEDWVRDRPRVHDGPSSGLSGTDLECPHRRGAFASRSVGRRDRFPVRRVLGCGVPLLDRWRGRDAREGEGEDHGQDHRRDECAARPDRMRHR